jgi:nucleoside-diphosphate-sugar epimerase
MTKPAVVLVTGATGFIGRWICLSLVHAGYQVRAAVRQLPADVPAGVDLAVVGDIVDADWADALVGVDVVVHLAGRAHRVDERHLSRGDEFFRVNAEATHKLAESSAGKVRRVIFVSSVGACRTAHDQPVTAMTEPAPSDDYGRSKLAGEDALRTALEGSSTDWCVLRPPLVYGPGARGNMERLIRIIDSGLPLPLGGIDNRRSLIFVGNLASAVLALLLEPAASRRTFVICDREVISTPQLLRLLSQFASRPLRLWTIPDAGLDALARAGDVLSRIARRPIAFDSYSLTRLRASLPIDDSTFQTTMNWQPPFTMKEGMDITFGRRPFVWDHSSDA